MVFINFTVVFDEWNQNCDTSSQFPIWKLVIRHIISENIVGTAKSRVVLTGALAFFGCVI